jgi:hypothetical protein
LFWGGNCKKSGSDMAAKLLRGGQHLWDERRHFNLVPTEMEYFLSLLFIST